MRWFRGEKVEPTDQETVREKYRCVKFMQEDICRVYDEMAEEGRKEVEQVREGKCFDFCRMRRLHLVAVSCSSNLPSPSKGVGKGSNKASSKGPYGVYS